MEYFHQLAAAVQDMCSQKEDFTLYYSAEESDFIRFNHAKIRQPGSVQQQNVVLRLIAAGKQVRSQFNLTGSFHDDIAKMTAVFQRLRARLQVVPVDPHLLINTEITSSTHIGATPSAPIEEMVDDIISGGKGLDMVGILANGSITKGFANSYGQRNWFQTNNFNYDWSFVENADKAVKSSYAGTVWKQAEFLATVEEAKRKLEALQLPSITLDPGEYRVILSPGALWEILGTVAWGGFGLKSQKTKISSLLKLVECEKRLSAKFSLFENIKDGASPNFQADGFIRPDRIALIEKGQHKNALVSPRSAKEYDVATNGAGMGESPAAIDVAAGDISYSDLRQRLDTGIDISNLWYLNYSDRANCGLTGMTRFATLWIENGEIKGPINPMRFDDTIYRMLGENLLGLTAERAFLLSASSYFERSTQSARLPGALIDNMRFTL